MELRIKFEQENARQIWDDYFYRIQRMMARVNPELRDEMLLELQSHLYDSFSRSRDPEQRDEVGPLLDAIKKMGKPEEYLRPVLAERLVSAPDALLKPKNLLLATLYHSYSGVRMSLVIALFGLGYLLALIPALIAILKVFFPENVGLFLSERGGLTFGLTEALPLAHDPLGYWTVPIGLMLSFLIYLAVSLALRRVILGKE